MYGEFSVPLDLASIQGGELNGDFREHYKELVATLRQGESGKITIEVKLKRPDELDTMMIVETSIRSQKPKRSRAQYAQLAADEHGVVSLKVDKPRPRPEPVSLFAVDREEENRRA